VLSKLLEGVGHLDVAVLNAGILGRFDDLASVDLANLRHVMEINVWANKTVIDGLFCSDRTIRQVVTISSGASVNGNRGWAGYSISKAALNMLTKLYAREHLETHFCALSPGVIDTPMLEELCALSPDDRFPALEALRRKRNTPEMPMPEEAAGLLIDVFARLPDLVESGEYADVRKLPSR
jgi:NAD(P)-dependent dehydrogenase (short-subunit alcohol dehydrogenase family)